MNKAQLRQKRDDLFVALRAENKELRAVLELALYDLAHLGRHEPGYRPRSTTRANAALNKPLPLELARYDLERLGQTRP